MDWLVIYLPTINLTSCPPVKAIGILKRGHWVNRMGVIETIHEKLQNYHEVKFEITDDHVIVFPRTAGGFSVSLYLDDNHYTVGFGGWHEEFTEEVEALNCFAFGLSEECRLVVARTGGFDYKWIVQRRTDDGWIDWSEVGIFWFPRWMTKRRYLQNDLIKAPYDRHPQ